MKANKQNGGVAPLILISGTIRSGQPHVLAGLLPGKEPCAFLGYCAAYSGNSLPTFRDNLSVPSSRVKNPLTFRDNLPFSS